MKDIGMLELSSELDILIATTVWLHNHGWAIESISPATGSGSPPIDQQKERVRRELVTAHVPFDASEVFKPKGPDIATYSNEETWKFECKGLGGGKPSTHKNSFDRAVASVVSYCDAPQTRLGLALANDYLWQYNFGDKLPQYLREAINLWVLLFENQAVYPYPPTEDLPYPGVLDE